MFKLALERKKYKPEKSFIYITFLGFIFLGSYYAFFISATFTIYPEVIAFLFWYLSVFFQIGAMTLWTSFYVLELHKNSKFKILVILLIFFLSGIVFGLLYDLHSFELSILGQNINYSFRNPLLLFFIIIFYYNIVFNLVIAQIKGYSNFYDKKLGKLYYVNTILFSTSIILYSIFLINQNDWIKHAHIIFYLLSSAFLFYIFLKKPSIFKVFTNKLYDFIIFHKSGILLYSYNFDTKKEVEESSLKGNILIGINHILSNFSNMENQVSVIKMSERGVIFNFNNELGYATLLIAKHKNSILEKAVNKFNLNFAKRNLETLTNIKGLIDVSKFRNTFELVQEYFKVYLL